MIKVGEITKNNVVASKQRNTITKSLELQFLEILERLQENIPFFMHKANTISLQMTASEWLKPLVASNYNIDDFNNAYRLIILLGFKNIVLSDFIKTIEIQKRYRPSDINQARKDVLLYSQSSNPISDILDIIKQIANRNAIARDNQIMWDSEKAISISSETRDTRTKEQKAEAQANLDKLKKMFL